MRELKSIKIIGVDAGYGNIKTANTVTPTGITACDNQPMNILYINDRKPMENRCWTEKLGARWKTRWVFHPGRRPGRDGSIRWIEAPRLISA